MQFSIVLDKSPNDAQDSEPLNTESYIGVFDGLGGAGATQIQNGKGELHANAWFASRFARVVVGSLFDDYIKDKKHDWTQSFNVKQVTDFRDNLDVRLRTLALAQGLNFSRLRGSLSKILPTTMAAVFWTVEKGEIYTHSFAVGDSRSYVFEKPAKDSICSMRQLSTDTTTTGVILDGMQSLANAPFETVMDDAVIHLNEKDPSPCFDVQYHFNKFTTPVMLLSCSDGCYYYLDSPMHFEYMVLSALMEADPEKGIKSYEERLKAKLHALGPVDDRSVAVNMIGFKDIAAAKAFFRPSYDALKQKLFGEFASRMQEIQNSYVSFYMLYCVRIAETLSQAYQYMETECRGTKSKIASEVDAAKKIERIRTRIKQLHTEMPPVPQNMFVSAPHNPMFAMPLSASTLDPRSRDLIVAYMSNLSKAARGITGSQTAAKCFEYIYSMHNGIFTVPINTTAIKRTIQENKYEILGHIWTKDYRFHYEKYTAEQKFIYSTKWIPPVKEPEPEPVEKEEKLALKAVPVAKGSHAAEKEKEPESEESKLTAIAAKLFAAPAAPEAAPAPAETAAEAEPVPSAEAPAPAAVPAAEMPAPVPAETPAPPPEPPAAAAEETVPTAPPSLEEKPPPTAWAPPTDITFGGEPTISPPAEADIPENKGGGV